MEQQAPPKVKISNVMYKEYRHNIANTTSQVQINFLRRQVVLCIITMFRCMDQFFMSWYAFPVELFYQLYKQETSNWYTVSARV